MLIIEDDADIGEFLIQVFKEETPYQVLLVPDGFAALNMVRTVTPHLILLDYQMPHLDGLECADALRASPGLSSVPIFMMSANLPKHARTRTDLIFLDKPFKLESLLQHIKHLFDS